MHYRSIGQSRINASVVGFGACPIGGWLWGETDEDASIRTIHAALDAGITLIDTAPAYGLGRSEELVGKALKGRREGVVIATKCGLVWHTQQGTFRFEQAGKGIYHYLAPESIRFELEQSLRRLRTDYVDLYMTHWPDVTTPIEDTMGELCRLREQGKIRAIGASNVTMADIEAYQRVGRLDAIEEKYSMLDRRLDVEHLPYCREHEIAVIAYSPMELGLLTGKIGPERTFPEGDMRRDDPRFSLEARQAVQRLLEAIRPVAQQHNLTFAQLAVAWAVHRVTHAMVGGKSEQQARENAAAGRVMLGLDELVAIERAIEMRVAHLAGWRPPQHPARRTAAAT